MARPTRIKTCHRYTNEERMGIYQHLHQDWLQLLLIGICMFDLIFFSYYLFSYELEQQNTISDSLFSHPGYATVLTFTLISRLLGAGLYLFR